MYFYWHTGNERPLGNTVMKNDFPPKISSYNYENFSQTCILESSFKSQEHVTLRQKFWAAIVKRAKFEFKIFLFFGVLRLHFLNFQNILTEQHNQASTTNETVAMCFIS